MAADNPFALARSSLWTVVTRAGILVCSMFILLLTTRYLGSAGRGTYALVVLCANILRMVSNLGLELNVVRSVASNRIPADRALGLTAGLSSIVAMLLVALFLITHRVWGLPFLQGIDADVLAIGILAVPFMVITSSSAHVYLGEGKVVAYNVVFLAHPLLAAVGMWILLVWMGATVREAISCWTIAHIAVAVVCMTWRWARGELSLRGGLRGIRAALGFGTRIMGANLLQFLNYRFDMLLVNHYLGLSQVGLYSAAVGVGELLLHIPQAVGTIVFPRVAAAQGAGTETDSPRVLRWILAIVLVSALGMALLAPWGFRYILSEEFVKALPAFYLLLPGLVALGASRIVVNDLAGRGMPGFNLVVSLATLILNVALNLMLIPRLGIRGAAVATTICYLIGAILLLAKFRSLYRLRISELLLLGSADLHEAWASARRLTRRTRS